MPNICLTCGTKFNSYNRLQYHIKDVHYEGRYKCMLCNTDQFTFKKLYKHNIVHVHNAIYECELCNTVFTNITKMENHIQDVHTKYEYKCIRDDCTITSSIYTEFSQMHRTLNNYDHVSHTEKCTYCELFFPKKELLYEHVQFHYENTSNFQYNCCDNLYYKLSELQTHFAVSHDIRFQCTICHVKCSNQYTYKNHFQQYHNHVTNYITIKYNCNYCKKLINHNVYNTHIQSCENDQLQSIYQTEQSIYQTEQYIYTPEQYTYENNSTYSYNYNYPKMF